MLKVRAALEDKLRQKGVFSSIAPKPDRSHKNIQPINRYLFAQNKFNHALFAIFGINSCNL